MTLEPHADARDMFVVHAMFRREFGLMPGLVRAVAAGDSARAALVADHVALMSEGPAAHHQGEDDHLCARFEIGVPAARGALDALDAQGVGACVDHEVGVAARPCGGPDLGHALVQVDQLLAVKVAAALRHDLVLQVDSRRPRPLERLDREMDVHRVPEAGVGVAHDRDANAARDAPGHGDHVRHGHDRVVRITRLHGGDAEPRALHRGEPGPLGEFGAERVEGARHDQQLRAQDELLQPRGWTFSRQLSLLCP
jgi:hypothetical protein